MRFLLGLAIGLPLGALFAAVTGSFSRWPLRRLPAIEPLEVLPPGANAWSLLACAAGKPERLWTLTDGRVAVGSESATSIWDPRTRALGPGEAPQPLRLARPSSAALRRWFPAGDQRALSVWEGGERLFIEPGHLPLPQLPAAKLARDLQAATLLSSDAVLAVVFDGRADRHRGFLLAPGAAEFTDLGLLDVPTAGGDLVPGPAAGALFISQSGNILRFDGKRFRALPAHQRKRYGQQASLAGDGTVIAGGGQPDRRSPRTALLQLAPWVALFCAPLAAVLISRHLHASLLGALAGGALGVALVVVTFRLLPRAARRPSEPLQL